MVLVTFWTLDGQLENGAATYGRTRENERNTNTKMRNESRICRSATIALGLNSLPSYTSIPLVVSIVSIVLVVE